MDFNQVNGHQFAMWHLLNGSREQEVEGTLAESRVSEREKSPEDSGTCILVTFLEVQRSRAFQDIPLR